MGQGLCTLLECGGCTEDPWEKYKPKHPEWLTKPLDRVLGALGYRRDIIQDMGLREKPKPRPPWLPTIKEVEVEAFEVEDGGFSPAKRQKEHQQKREEELGATPLMPSRFKSNVDDIIPMQNWLDYRASPTPLFGSKKMSEVGVQRIDLPFNPMELERVAAWLDDEKRSGMEALRPFHRLNTPERIEAWKARFDNLDLGSYDEVRDPATSETMEASGSEEAAGAASLQGLKWSVLIMEPNRFFQLHKHPNIEVVFCARGAIYENRVLSSALLNYQRDQNAQLVDSGFPKFFKVMQHAGGTAYDHPRYSVDQVYTLDEGAVVLTLWSGKHVLLNDPDGLMWKPSRCQNPKAPLACPDGTFEALAKNSAKQLKKSSPELPEGVDDEGRV